MPTKILAIDDSKTMRLAIKITFAAEDAEVTAVSKASEAVPRAKQIGPDLILVDVALGDGEPSGYDVCKTLRADPDTAGVPVVLMASGQTGIDEGQLAACGAAGWLSKPFETQELIDMVAQHAQGGLAQPVAGVQPAAQPAAAAPAPAANVASARPAPASPAAAQPSTAQPGAAQPGAAQPAAAQPAAAQPAAAQPAAAQPAAVQAPSSGAGEGGIPIAIPIPFVAAGAPTPGILERLRRSQGPGADLDPKVAQALVGLSREVLEAIAWEVIPELAEQVIREQAAARLNAS